MKFSKAILFILVLQHLFGLSFSQQIQNKQFEKCKGKLPFPVCTVYKYNNINCKKCDVDVSPYSLTFITDSAAEVRAIYDGIVAKVFPVEDGYGIVTRVGDYYLTHYPLTNPTYKKGDLIFSGQPISRTGSSASHTDVNILMSKTTTFIDPYKWFKW